MKTNPSATNSHTDPDYSTLARGTMRTVKIAFDVDGTLRCNHTETCEDSNGDIVSMFRYLRKFKNVELYVWSGGGAKYAYRFAQLYKLPIKESHCISKFGAPNKMDIAIDDIQETDLGLINLIVREK